MVLTYNGQASPQGMITLTNVPNILTIQSSSVTGNNSVLKITINDLTKIDPNNTYYITINGLTITSGNVGNNFYISNSNTGTNQIAVAHSIAKSLRSVGLTNYEIYQEISQGILTNVVIVEAREVGELYEITFDSNLGAAILYNNYVGTTSDEFAGGRINIDVYSGSDYITTLEKSYYKEKTDFNVSDVLKSISRYDFLVPYTLFIYSQIGNQVTNLGRVSATSAIGYMVNQGEKFLNTYPMFAQNVSRGTSSPSKMVLYTYLSTIPVTIYSDDVVETVNITYYDSSLQQIGTGFSNVNIYNGIGQSDIALNSNLFNSAYYVDLSLENGQIIRYNVIKPVDANSRCQRVYYHNSYGGVSFFDFTGQITENHKVDNDTYTKNIYDYYRETTLEQIKIYDKETTINVTMKSHLMERSAVWQFNDLLGSYDVWTNINGVDYKIIVTDCKVDETETGVWEATVTYTYSLI